MIAVKEQGSAVDAFRSQTDWLTKNSGKTTAVGVTIDTVMAMRKLKLAIVDIPIVMLMT